MPKYLKIPGNSYLILVESYICNRDNLIKIFILNRFAKFGIKNSDIDIFDFVASSNKNFSIVLTKIDKCSTDFIKKTNGINCDFNAKLQKKLYCNIFCQ